jgi:uncharacterized membrane protein
MADLPSDPPPPAPTSQASTSSNVPVSSTLVVYLLFGLAAVVALVGHGMAVGAPLLTLIGIVAVIIAYVKRDDARGTWTESHLTWLIRTFWWSFLWNCIGWLILFTLGLVLIGIPIAIAIWVITTIWVIYRLVRGYLYFKDSQPIPT